MTAEVCMIWAIVDGYKNDSVEWGGGVRCFCQAQTYEAQLRRHAFQLAGGLCKPSPRTRTSRGPVRGTSEEASQDQQRRQLCNQRSSQSSGLCESGQRTLGILLVDEEESADITGAAEPLARSSQTTRARAFDSPYPNPTDRISYCFA